MKIELAMSENLSKHLSYREATFSSTAERFGIENKPTFEQLYCMKHLALNFFEPLRNHFGVPIKVNSFFRSQELNKKIGGAKKSDHMILSDVCAIDIDDTYSRHHGVYNRDIFQYIRENMDFYKLIWEFDEYIDGKPNPKWIHISYSTDEKKNKERNMFYTLDGRIYNKF